MRLNINPLIFNYDLDREHHKEARHKVIAFTNKSMYISDSKSALRLNCENKDLNNEVIYLDFFKLKKYFNHFSETFSIDIVENIEKKASNFSSYKIFYNDIYVCDSEAFHAPAFINVFNERKNKIFSLILKDIERIKYVHRLEIKDKNINFYDKGENVIYSAELKDEADNVTILLKENLNGFNAKKDIKFSLYREWKYTYIFHLQVKDMEYLEIGIWEE